ncbi:MAG: hypothetical protein IKS83_00820, partial [Victivallales bacterium]|nr:hypothetical protein [Victivallales bacterium]
RLITTAGLPDTSARKRSQRSEASVMAPCTTNIAATGKRPCNSGADTLSIGEEINWNGRGDSPHYAKGEAEKRRSP